MYMSILVLHSLLRWLVLLLGLVALARGLSGWLGSKPWTAVDNRFSAFFVISLDVQMLIGLILYFALSPLTTMGFENMGAAMQNSVVRFFLVEHLVMMVVAIALAHVGRAKSKKANDVAAKHRLGAIFFGLALAAILYAIPWTFTAARRAAEGV